MNKNQQSLLFVIITCILLSLQFCPPYDLQLDDKDVFRYGGMVILKGLVPYRDLFDHKPPLIFFLNFAGLAMGSWGLWFLDLGLALLTSIVLFNLCRKHRLPFPWLLPLLFNLMIRDFLVTQGIGLTREYTCFFQVLFFCVMLGSHRYRYILMGGLAALTFFMQQDQVLFMAPLFVYVVARAGRASARGRAVAQMAAGFGMVMLPIVVYFTVHHSLAEFWKDAFAFNFSVYTAKKQSPGSLFRGLKYQMDAGNFELPFMVATVLGVFSLVLRHRNKQLVIAAMAALALSLVQEYMNPQSGQTWFMYYMTSLSAGVCCLLWAVAAFADDPVLAHPKAQLAYGILLCASLLYTSLQHMTHLHRAEQDTTPAYIYLRRHPPGDYQLYVFGSNDDIHAYTDLGVLAPSKWIYQQFWRWYPQWDTDNAILGSIGQDLLRHRTTYLLTDSAGISKILRPSSRDWWMNFTRTWYEPVLTPDSTGRMLWRLKNLSR